MRKSIKFTQVYKCKTRSLDLSRVRRRFEKSQADRQINRLKHLKRRIDGRMEDRRTKTYKTPFEQFCDGRMNDGPTVKWLKESQSTRLKM